MARPSIRIVVEVGDALKYRADVIVLKHAQKLYGVDGAVFEKLRRAGNPLRLPRIGDHKLIRSRDSIGADQVLFVGVEELRNLGYGEIREFGRRAMSILRTTEGNFRKVALTLHGPGYGLDETESFESVLAGVIEAIAHNDYPRSLELISIVEIDRSRAKRLSAVLARLLPMGRLERSGHGFLIGLDRPAKQALKAAGYRSAAKPRVFVAMPFAESMNDTFHFGIQGAVNSAGLLAERADLATFTGDVLEWVKERIAGANLVIADVTGGNPNVYLEVGYAWGRGVPTILLTKKARDLKFDVRGQRCIVYSSIRDLEQRLTTELNGILPAR